MKGPLPYNYFSEVDWAFHQDSWMGQVLDNCDWEWVPKDFAKDDMFCSNVGMCPMTSIVIFRSNISLSPMPASTTNSQVLSIVWLMSCISKTSMNGLHMVDLSRPASSSSEFQWWTRLVSRWSAVWSLWNKVWAQLVCWLTSYCSLQSVR